LMRSSIMTEKLVRRGTNVRTEYTADYLDRIAVRDAASKDVITLASNRTLGDVREWLTSSDKNATHQGYPVVDPNDELLGVVTRRDLLDPSHDGDRLVGELLRRRPAVVFEHNTLREAADHMVHEGVGRLPVVTADAPRKVVGIISRSDLLSAHRNRLDAALVEEAPPIGRGFLRRQSRRQRRGATKV
ncbi:MAG TPA: CBS domain-containing protein, partial [Polyangia bacterium]|nr:CBS domain-containing protein [Polyangia bacterium]